MGHGRKRIKYIDGCFLFAINRRKKKTLKKELHEQVVSEKENGDIIQIGPCKYNIIISEA
jgi:hypothetical protein